MSSEMIERVGEALAVACLSEFGSTWSNDVRWRFARAAFEAMRDLTQPMLDVGTKDTGWGDCEESEIQFRWNAMISAALSSPAEDM